MFTQLVDRVIALSAAIDRHCTQALIDRHPDVVRNGFIHCPLSYFDDLPPAPQESELRDLLHGLPWAQLIMLEVIVQFGRDAFDPEADLLDAYGWVSDTCHRRQDQVDYLLGKQLDCHLTQGMEILADRRRQIDTLMAGPLQP